jgi:hypothetical protein
MILMVTVYITLYVRDQDVTDPERQFINHRTTPSFRVSPNTPYHPIRPL